MAIGWRPAREEDDIETTSSRRKALNILDFNNLRFVSIQVHPPSNPQGGAGKRSPFVVGVAKFFGKGPIVTL